MRRRPRQRGFSLIEIMIGLLIGMFAVLIILQLLSSVGKQQRIGSGSGDAQINGATATHILRRELQEAGMGISAFTLLGCSLTYTNSKGNTVTLPALAPVTINPATGVVPAGDANTDTLLVFAGSSASPSEGDATLVASTATSFRVATPTAFAVGSWVAGAAITRDATSACALQMGKITTITADVLNVSAGTSGLPIGSAVYDMGAAPVIHAYAVRNGNLTMCDYLVNDCGNAASATTVDPSVWVPVAGNIVSLRAQYGRDTSDLTTPKMDGVVDTYDQATPASGTGLAPYCGWLRVVGVRMAVVARSQQYDNDAAKIASTVAPIWSGSVANAAVTGVLTTTTPTAVPIDLSSNPEWKGYRYKTIETTVPLRNIIWNGNQVLYQNGSVKC